MEPNVGLFNDSEIGNLLKDACARQKDVVWCAWVKYYKLAFVVEIDSIDDLKG